MMMMGRRLACCTRDRETSIDFDEQERIMSYNGLETCIINNQSYENESGTSRGDGCISDSLDDDESSCSSSKDAFGSFSSKWLTMKNDESLDEWDLSASPQHFYVKEKPAYAIHYSDKEIMKEKFARLLLGDDITGGRKGITTALALSKAITNLAASVFGELWKLEPLNEERKNKWRREMDWLLSPANYMVELVPAKQNGANGRTLEIMTPKARSDIHMNLPALQKLDSMLIETLDSMVDTEFWYSEVGTRAEGKSKSAKQSKKWWLPQPQVPRAGLSELERKKLLHQIQMVYQIFKAAKAINEHVLLEMPVPDIIRDALPRSGKLNLGENLYKALTAGSSTAEEMLNSLRLKSENSALEVFNKLESAMFVWKERITAQTSGRSPVRTSWSPVRTSWSFVKDPLSEIDKSESLIDRGEALMRQLKMRYPNLSQSFFDIVKIQYGKDVGHSILEAYSRVLGNLSYSILSRMGDIVKQDIVSNPNSPVATAYFPGKDIALNQEKLQQIRHSLTDQMNKVDGKDQQFNASEWEFSDTEGREISVNSTPSRSRVWCISREACIGVSPIDSP
ncbi:hypothetical protein K2173_004575 [Erythroxylum novogranatense]|uniref:PRONE domain-containing protein n=1 Tax=Erythroxylum novogranatense TaxID=1862640 RepID=A0AAV8S4Q8_9ROSI|nr:hypothetical protein K2173_004575 [Erythroxylum novogranatense]